MVLIPEDKYNRMMSETRAPPVQLNDATTQTATTEQETPPPPDQEMKCLCKRAFPGKSKTLIEAYNDCTRKPYGYLVLDLSPHSEEGYRIRTGVFPDETCVVYKPL
uniref:Uncharacterized protein n=1 Tax=Magallana gigas TaxID=29159 RepID=A0A8W8MKK3_MAGGI